MRTAESGHLCVKKPVFHNPTTTQLSSFRPSGVCSSSVRGGQMSDLIKQITSDFQKQIESFNPEASVSDIGTVLEAGDGIAKVQGLTYVRSQELVQFENGVMGIAFTLERDAVGVIIVGEYSGITEGMTVRSTGRIASVPVGDGLIGRVVNGLGEPIDGKGPINFSGYRPIERIA